MPNTLSPNVTVVIPVCNDAQRLRELLADLKGLEVALVISDGGSTDGSLDVALEAGARVVVGIANRGEQLARGAAVATSQWILFLHCDSRLKPEVAEQLFALAQTDKPAWGRFDVSLHPNSKGLRCVAWFMNVRSRLTKICTGDQGIFVHRDLLLGIEPLGGLPCQPLMEDIELCIRLRTRANAFVALPGPLISSARRWRRDGLVGTVLSMWRFRLQYWLGKSPEDLVTAYYGKSKGG